MTFYFLMGCTCAGKGTFIRILKDHQAASRLQRDVGFVEVGAEFRRRYPPGHFKGQANPPHLMAEAMQIYDEQVDAARRSGKAALVVDGQPRQGQVAPILRSLLPGDKVHFILLDAPEEVRGERARQRFEWQRFEWGSSPEYDACLERIQNDFKTYYQVLVELLQCGHYPYVVNTNCPANQWSWEVINLLAKLWDQG